MNTLLPANSIELSSIELILEKLHEYKMIKTSDCATYMFFSKMNFVMPTSCTAFDAILSILQFITAIFSNAI